MKFRIVGISLVLVLVFAGCSGIWPFIKNDGFVKVDGTHFTHNDHRYYYTGTNMWYGCYLGSPGQTGNRARLLRELDSLQLFGLKNVRILAGSEFSHKIRSVKPAIVCEPGVVDDSLLLGLDFVLSEMAKRNMKAVLYFTNYWEWSGGMSQYVAWADSSRSLDPEVDGWGKFMLYSARFYKNEKANALFLPYVKKIVTRVNAYNGRTYSEDPTIMAWQLANEPRPGAESPEGGSDLPSYYRWIDRTAGYIKSLDTNHLVSSGNEGLAGSLQNEKIYLTAHASTHIDYLTIHVWPLNWGWFNPKKYEETLPGSQEKAIAYIGEHLQFARQLRKPLVMEEFGIGRDTGAFAPGSPTTARDRYYQKIFSVMYDSARAGSPMAGSNFWAWGGEGRTPNADCMWKMGDTFTGDPPQEPQGVNSIFDTDVSTLAILKASARLMHRLGTVDSLFLHDRFVKR
jgi:mannan endo-1,4-beta-mannosidase